MHDELGFYLGAVFSLWLALWTGVGAALLTTWEKRKGKPLTWRGYLFYSVVALLVAAVPLAAHGTYRELLVARARLEQSENARTRLEAQASEARIERDRLQRQTNEVLTELSRRPPGPIEVRVPPARWDEGAVKAQLHAVQRGEMTPDGYSAEIVVRTNAPLLRPVFRFVFDGPIESFQIVPLPMDWRQREKWINRTTVEQTYPETQFRPEDPASFRFTAKRTTKFRSITYRE